MSELREVENDQTILTEALAGRRSLISQIEERLQKQKSELNIYENSVEAYMMNHKMAVAALASAAGGGAVALDSENEFSDEVQAIGAGFTVFGALYILSNSEEVIELLDQLIQADAHVKNLRSHINETQRNLNHELNLLQSEEERFMSNTERIRYIRSQIKRL